MSKEFDSIREVGKSDNLEEGVIDGVSVSLRARILQIPRNVDGVLQESRVGRIPRESVNARVEAGVFAQSGSPQGLRR